MRHAVLPVVPALLLGACAATGSRFDDHLAAAPAMADEQARLVVFRQRNTPQYSVREARLEVDRTAAGTVMPAGFRVFDVAAGSHTIVVDMWDAPGRCELTLDLKGGATHYVEVAPRIESWAAGAPALAAPALAPLGTYGGLLATALLLSGMAVESAGKPCGGAYSLVAVDGAEALPKLAQMRSSQ